MLLEPFIVKFCALPRSVVRRCSIKKGVPNNFAKFTEKHLCRSLFFDKAAGRRTETLLKRDSSTDLFQCIFQNTLWYQLGDILLLFLVDIFCSYCCCWCCHDKFLIKFSLTPLGRRKAVSTLLDVISLNVCLRFI